MSTCYMANYNRMKYSTFGVSKPESRIHISYACVHINFDQDITEQNRISKILFTTLIAVFKNYFQFI